MKLLVGGLYDLANGKAGKELAEAYGDGLPPRVSIVVKRLLNSVDAEIKVVEPERIKLLSQYATKNEEKNTYDLPDMKTKKGKEFIGLWNELMGTETEIKYEPIDLDKFVDAMDNIGKIIKGSVLDLIELLNKTYEFEKEAPKKEESASEKAEEKTEH